MSDNIDTRITPALHPDNVKTIDGYQDHAVFLAPTEAAFSTAYAAVRSIHDAREKAEADPTMNEAARLVVIDDFARKQMGRITHAFDSTRENLSKGIASMEAELSAPVTAKASHAIAAEIRAHVKAMPTGERLAFVQKAIADGDEVTVSSVLGGPHYLSGFESADLHGTMLRLWHEKSNPEKSARLRAMAGAKEMIERNAPLIFPQIEKAVGASGVKVKKLREAKNAAEQARILSVA